MKWTSRKASLVWIPITAATIVATASAVGLIAWLLGAQWFAVFVMVSMLGGLVGLILLSHFAAQYPNSWLAFVATFSAVIAVFILGAAVLVAIGERMATLSHQNQCALFILAFYAGCFALYEVTAREQRRKHCQLGEMSANGWVRRFKEITPNTDNNILQSLYEDGVVLRDEFGNLTHPDFKKDLEVLADLLKPDQ